MSDYVKWETYVEAPKKLEFKSFLYDLNMKYGTELEILDHDRVFFRETIRFKFKGERSKVVALRKEYIQVVLETLEKYNQSTLDTETIAKQLDNEYASFEKYNEKKKDSEFIGERCKVLGAEITYSSNHVKIDIWTTTDKQNDDIYNLAKNIKKHFGIEYKIAINSDGVTIDVNANNEQTQIFANTVNHYLDWKIEPIIINQIINQPVLKNNKP